MHELLAERAPTGVRAFAYVNAHPSPLTPAGAGGLALGDAIVQLGEATHLRDLQGQLQTNLGRRLPVLVVDMHGRFIRKHIVPQQW